MTNSSSESNSSQSSSSSSVFTGLCGDGLLQQGEDCDLGSTCAKDPASCNRVPGTAGGVCACDPHDPNCHLIAGTSYQKGCQWPRCGDGVINNFVNLNGLQLNFDFLREECDDGPKNGTPDDPCSVSCRIITSSSSSSSIRLLSCGNGILDPGEQCDFGTQNGLPGSACSSYCQFTALPGCGDGHLDQGEICDDGASNGTPGDACTLECKRTITQPCSGRQQCGSNVCSSGACAGCTTDAQCPGGESCVSGLCIPKASCGDGIRQPGERCDDGSRCAADPASCNRAPLTRAANCACIPGDPTCIALPDLMWSEACTWSFCGNDILDNWAVWNGKTVDYVGLHEECDHGAQNGKPGDGCTTSCLLVRPDLCGNGAVDAGEQCDLGSKNGKPGITCSSTCQSVVPARCGNARLEGGEECDDGGKNGTPGDGCSNSCTRLTLSRTFCGNGKLDPGEECDHADQNGTDGVCSGNCLLLQGFCGDGIVQKLLGEQCEPSTFDNSLPYHCGNDCRFASDFCGDGVIQAGEQCDDAGFNSDALPDHCRTNCSASRCGDGILDSGEQCDDGARNGKPGDPCDLFCRIKNAAAPENLAQTIELPLLASFTRQPQTGTGITTIAISHPPAGRTGPASVAFMAAGAAAGYAWVRRRRRRKMERG
ncbi:hypothetical protein HYR82_02950 [Candidatus Peregrinibacteria bacterium]|nr:hypothetical protein [Candidatus Peregrinibacteria bacterium]